MAEKKLIDPNEFWERLNKASYDVITYPDREMDCAQFGYYTDTIQAVLNQTKKVDAVEVVHGRWIDIYDGLYANKVYKCSVCGNDAPIEERYPVIGRKYTDWSLTNYCPNCGAKMDGGNEDV